MFKNKKHLFFDLDHTLWDYEKCSNETLKELYQEFELSNRGFEINSFLQQFRIINEALWDQFHLGKIDKEVIRTDRFPAILKALNIEDNNLALLIQAEYLNNCPYKPYLIEGAFEILTTLAERYTLHIITNGFDEIQAIKMNSGGIHHFFKEIITSGQVGFHKPDKRIFEYAFSKVKTTAEESLMIGDNPISDIEGAYNAGLEQIFFNPGNQQCPIIPTLEVNSLKEILSHL